MNDMHANFDNKYVVVFVALVNRQFINLTVNNF